MFVYILYSPPVGVECLKKVCIKFKKQRLIILLLIGNHRRTNKHGLLARTNKKIIIETTLTNE